MDLDLLDKLAATEVMGWYLDEQTQVYLKSNVESPKVSDHTWFATEKSDWGSGFHWYQPTRDIAQAWELLEKMKGRIHVERFDDPIWQCQINIDTETADTAPLAITKACLKAKGVKIDE